MTEALSRTLPSDVVITATDLNLPMIRTRQSEAPAWSVSLWRQADAMKLPFSDAAFDLIVCQFGVMFFPDKQASFRESFRVLAPSGTYLFVLWDDWATMADSPNWTAALAVGDMLGRDPHTLLNPGYFDEPTIRADLEAVGFRDVSIDRIARPSKAASARDAAVITVQGSLLRTAIEAADSSASAKATDADGERMSYAHPLSANSDGRSGQIRRWSSLRQSRNKPAELTSFSHQYPNLAFLKRHH